MINIIFDTNIIRQEGLQSQSMQLLKRLVKGKKVQVYIPDMVRREYLTQKSLEVSDNLHKICRNIDKIQRGKLFTETHNKELQKISKFLNGLTNEIPQTFTESFQNWINRMEAEVVEVDPFCIEEILNDYFEGENAFRRPKSRDDFPDAIIMSAISEVLEELEEINGNLPLYAILCDGHFKECLNVKKNITTVSSLKKLFSLPPVEKAVNELDAESDRIQSIKKYLATAGCRQKLEDFIYSDQSDLAIPYWDENEISDPDGILELKIISVYTEEIDLDFISNLAFGKINYLGDESYTIECSLTATLELNIVADYGDYLHLEEHSKKHFEFVSADDGFCELKTNASCNFVGNIELDIAEKLNPEQLALHFQYLHTAESPIFTAVEFKKIIISDL